MGTSIDGTNVIAGIRPFNTDDEFDTHAAEYGKGGHRTVDDMTALYAIPAARREEGMSAWVKDAGSGAPVQYRLIGGILDVNWTPVPGGVTTVGGLDYLGVLALMGLA